METAELAGISDEERLREFVAGRDVACPSCGYNLRGLKRAMCPECAQALTLRVGLVEPRLGIWVAALVGAAAGAGFNGLLLVYVLLEVTVRGMPALRGIVGSFVLCNALGLLVMGGGVAALVREGRRFRRANRQAQLWMAALAWAGAFVDVAVFSASIR